jgi:ATP-dependent exoDNAse (exonuclease V) alpha subunit
MALFHYHVHLIGRSNGKAGRSVVAAAAYRAGVALWDERLNKIWDYSKKHGVTHREILVPVGSHAWAKDRQTLWGNVEASEKRVDAQLAREIEGAIPREIPSGERVPWVREHLRTFVDLGMVVDFAIHDPAPGLNPHFHALATLRPLEGDGFAKKKNRAWNDLSLVEAWRSHYEEVLTRALLAAGTMARVCRLSYLRQGIAKPPQGHQSRAECHRQKRSGIAREGPGVPASSGEAAALSLLQAIELSRKENYRGRSHLDRAMDAPHKGR